MGVGLAEYAIPHVANTNEVGERIVLALVPYSLGRHNLRLRRRRTVRRKNGQDSARDDSAKMGWTARHGYRLGYKLSPLCDGRSGGVEPVYRYLHRPLVLDTVAS